jgi:CTP synthase (UTP-ammonia lyase)
MKTEFQAKFRDENNSFTFIFFIYFLSHRERLQFRWTENSAKSHKSLGIKPEAAVVWCSLDGVNIHYVATPRWTPEQFILMPRRR